MNSLFDTLKSLGPLRLGVMAVTSTSLRLLDRTLFGVLGGVQMLAFLILLKAPEVKEFMRAQRERTN